MKKRKSLKVCKGCKQFECNEKKASCEYDKHSTLGCGQSFSKTMFEKRSAPSQCRRKDKHIKILVEAIKSKRIVTC